MLKKHVFGLLGVLLGLFVFGAVWADVELQYKDADEALTVLQLSGNAVRMDRSGEPAYMLYQHDKQQLNMVDAKRNQGQSITPATIQALTEQAKKIRETLQARMAHLSPRQQQLMREQLGGMAALLDGEREYSVAKLDGSKVSSMVNGVNCQRVKLLIDGAPHYEYCVATPAALGLDSAESAALEGLTNTLASLAAQMGGGDNPMALVSLSTLGGVPLEMKSLTDSGISRLVGYRKEPIAGKRFQLPEGLKLQPLAPSR